jgi:hypothetical protein
MYWRIRISNQNSMNYLQKLLYAILFGWQCIKLALYSTFNLAVTIVYLFTMQLMQVTLRTGKKLLGMPL